MIKGNVAYALGKYHAKSQDAYCILPLPNMWVAAVADGVGSCKYAEKASLIAVQTVVDFIRENWPVDNEPVSVKSMLRTAFNRAMIEVKKEADRAGELLSEYDTTLMVVAYDGENGYFAHVGDGGIVGLKANGTYVELSTRQQTEDGFVIPLRAGYRYFQIEQFEGMASILLATDGMMDKFRNARLEQGFYVPMLMLFADPKVVECLRRKIDYSKFVSDPRSVSPQVIYNGVYHALRKGYRLKKATVQNIISSVKRGMLFSFLDNISDDKTALCLYNSEANPSAQGVSFYMEPDWQRVLKQQRAMLYPELKESLDKSDASDQASEIKQVKIGGKRFWLFEKLAKLLKRNG